MKKRLIYAAIVLTVTACVAFGQEPDGEANSIRPDSGVVDRPTVYDIGIVPVVDPETPVEEPDVEVAPEGKAEKLVVFSATWCINCKPLVAVASQLKAEGYDVEVIKIDTREGEEKWKKYSNIKNVKPANKINEFSAVPATFYIRDGMIVKKEIGVKSRSHILKTLWKSEDSKNAIDKIRDRLPWNN